MIRLPASPTKYSASGLSRLASVPESKVRYWGARGLLAETGAYGFPDLIALRTIARLRKAGLSERRILKTHRLLRKLFPELRHPFSELAFHVEARSRVLVQYKSAVFDPRGQLVLRF